MIFNLIKIEVHKKGAENWKVTVIDTGTNSMTGGRLKRVRDYLEDEPFYFTYGDGVGNVDIKASLDLHNSSNRKATMTAVQPPGRFGALHIEGDKVTQFQEKPEGDGSWINGGFFVLEPSVMDYIESDSTIWERSPLETLAIEGELSVYKHNGFWCPMDTMRDKIMLNELWEKIKPLETLGMIENIQNSFKNLRVLITGDTGFKGSWLCEWLLTMGSECFGVGLAPNTNPSLFNKLELEKRLQHRELDIRDYSRTKETSFRYSA